MIFRVSILSVVFFHLFGSSISEEIENCELTQNGAVCNTIDDYRRRNVTATNLTITNCTTDVLEFSSQNTINQYVFKTVSNLTIKCPVRYISRDFIDEFPNLKYFNLPFCNITKLKWQDIYSESLEIIDLSTCPIECSCDHLWMLPGTEFIKQKPPTSLKKCLVACHHGSLAVENRIVTGEQGENVTIRVKVADMTINGSFERPYFEWAFANDDHNFEERISDSSLELLVTNLSEKNIGMIGVRCWHCVDYLTTEIQLQVNVSLKLEFIEKTHGDTDVLVVHGFPIDNITLKITRPLDNISEFHEIGNDDALYFESLVIRPEKRSLFYRRTFIIFTKDASEGDHLMGNLLFEVCSATSCDSVSRHVGHLGVLTTTSVSKKDNEERDYSGLLLLLILPIIFLGLGFAIYHFRDKIQNFVHEKITSFRKRIPWSAELQSRRASRETEETLLRLEERSSLSSSDYTNQIIPFIDIGNIKIHENIGKGAFGEVYCGSWEKLGERSVAVKTIKQADSEVEKEALVLSRLDHANIVRLYGMTRDNGNLLLVFEMMNLGDLRTYLRSRAPQASNYSQFPPALVENELKKIIVDVISGVCYLVAQQIVHRDLAARNCLVSGKSDLRSCTPAQRPPITVKISDFGMSRRLYSDSDYYRMEHHSLLPVRWLPPEAITDHKFSHMSDVWSLGVTMWEIFSYGQVPFSELSNHEVVSYAIAGMRPPKTKLCPKDMYELMEKCWTMDPEKRIGCDEILLDEVFQSISQKPSSSMNNGTAIIPLEQIV